MAGLADGGAQKCYCRTGKDVAAAVDVLRRAGAVHAGARGNALHRWLCCNFLADSFQFFLPVLAPRPVLRILAPGCFWRDADLGGG